MDTPCEREPLGPGKIVVVERENADAQIELGTSRLEQSREGRLPCPLPARQTDPAQAPRPPALGERGREAAEVARLPAIEGREAGEECGGHDLSRPPHDTQRLRLVARFCQRSAPVPNVHAMLASRLGEERRPAPEKRPDPDPFDLDLDDHGEAP
jgi:hypothetical protein